jgi:N-acylglucosamine-6-phosphate 2-epimerase
MSALDALRGVIVSCQSAPGDPTDSPAMMVAYAESAQRGGAVGLRLNSAEHIAAVKAAVDLPVIGIEKSTGADGVVLITGSVAEVGPLIDAGAEIIAFDATERERPDAREAIVAAIHDGGALAMADLRRFEDAETAVALGVDALGTTLSVFDLPEYLPNIALVERLATAYDLPVIAEGNFWDPRDVTRAFDVGAAAVVIGSAITRPWLITERYVRAARR